MATLAQLNAFITYLNQQWNFMTVDGTVYGQPYVWGAQHTHLTPSNYQSVINSMESETYDRIYAKQYCKRLFDAGATDLYAYDCSGLGMYFWQNLQHEYGGDLNANGMMGRCTLYRDPPKKGWWVFKCNSNGRAYHIGYMVDNTHVVEAYGRAYGVVRTEFKEALWSKWGIPNILKEVIPAPGDPGHSGTNGSTSCQTTSGIQEEIISFLRIKVRGNKKRSVNVRTGPSTEYKVLFTAHGGDSFHLLYVSPETGWYKIETDRGPGYITNKTKYTEIIEEE